MPSKKKKYNARFPAGRIKKIMQMDDDVGKIAHGVPVVISRSVELFVNSLLQQTATITRERNAKTLSLTHTKHCILREQKYDFLKDLVKNIEDVSPEDEKKSSRNNIVLPTFPQGIPGANCDISRKRIKSEPRFGESDDNAPSKRRHSDCDTSPNVPAVKDFTGDPSVAGSSNSFHNNNRNNCNNETPTNSESFCFYDLIIDEERDGRF